MSEIKMSDVFDGGVFSDADTLMSNGYGEIADFSGYKKECRYAAHAINSHDKLTEQNARLVEMLELALDAACEPYSCSEDFCERVSELLAEIKGQK